VSGYTGGAGWEVVVASTVVVVAIVVSVVVVAGLVFVVGAIVEKSVDAVGEAAPSLHETSDVASTMAATEVTTRRRGEIVRGERIEEAVVL